MLYVFVLAVGLLVGAGPEKSNQAIDKVLSKGSEMTDVAKKKALELKDKINK